MMDMADTGAYRIDAANFCLWRRNGAGADERVDLPPKTFDVLRYLVENAGRLVTHDELLTAVWSGVHVQPEVLKSHILAIRTALGDKSTAPRFIETFRGRGYRLIGRIAGSTSWAAQPETASEPERLAGRSTPLAKLQDLLRKTLSGQQQVVFVSGEPGIGKTTLLQRFVIEARNDFDITVAEGGCIEGFGGIEPYYPVLEALGKLCDGPARTSTIRNILKLAPTWAAQMPQIVVESRPIPQLPVDSARSRMVREGAALIEALAAERPLLLLLEDLHWADYATVDLLSAICRRRPAVRLMLVVTYRSEELGTARHPLQDMAHDLAIRRLCSEIQLGPLSESAISEMLKGGTEGFQPPPHFTQFVTERSGGNPLFAELILEFLLQNGMVERIGNGWRLLTPISKSAFATPPTIERIFNLKIDHMPDEVRHVLEAASVAGVRFDPATVAGAAGVDEQGFEAICEEFARNSCTLRRDEQLTLPNGDLVQSYAFRHAVYREVLYDRIGLSRRAQLHRSVGNRIEEIYPADQRREIAVQLAHHFAGGQDWPKALNYLRSALHIADSRYARRDAFAILDYASDVASKLPDGMRQSAEMEFLEHRGAILAGVHDAKALDVYGEFVEKAKLTSDIDVQCRALSGLAYVLSWRNLARARQVLDELLILSEQQSDPVKRNMIRLNAHVRRIWVFGWNDDDARLAEEAFHLLTPCDVDFVAGRARLYFSMLCLLSSRYQKSLDLLRSGYQLASNSSPDKIEMAAVSTFWIRRVGVPWCLFSLGDLGAALKEYDATIEGFKKGNDLLAARVFQVYRGVMRFYALDFEGTIADCGIAAEKPAEDDEHTGIHVRPLERRIALIFSGLAKTNLGRNREARADLRSAETEMASHSAHLDWYWRLALEWGMVNLLISDGDKGAAFERADRLCDLAARTNEHTWQALAWEARARAELSFGNPAKALDHIASALEAAAGGCVPSAALRVRATAAMIHRALGDSESAREHAETGGALRKKLAESLPEKHALREVFEQASNHLLKSGYATP